MVLGPLLATLIVAGNANGTPAERYVLDSLEAASLPRRLSEGQPFVFFTRGLPTPSARSGCEYNGASDPARRERMKQLNYGFGYSGIGFAVVGTGLTTWALIPQGKR